MGEGRGGGVGEGWRIGKQSISKVHPSNCPPTPPLTQQQSIDNKLGLMLVHGRGKWAVAQILILIPSFYIMLTTTDLPPLPLKTTRSLLKRKQTNKQTKNVHVLLCKRFIQLLLLKILWQYITANHSMSKAQLTAPLIAYDIENRLLIVMILTGSRLNEKIC